MTRQYSAPGGLGRALTVGGLVLALATVAACDDDGAASGADGEGGAPPRPPSIRVIPVGSSPAGIAVGAGGVWVANSADGTLTRIDPAADGRSDQAIRVGSAPTDVTAGEEAVWVLTAGGRIVRVDPRRGRVVGKPMSVRDATGLAVGAGAVWVTSAAGGSVTRIDTATDKIEGDPIQVGPRPTDVVVGAGGVWVANSGDGTVTRIDPRTGRVVGQPTAVAEEQLLALAVGFGRVWAAKTDSALAERTELVAIDPETHELDGESVRIPAGVPTRLAAGEGALWATDVGKLTPPSRRPAAVVRIDPKARALAGRPIRIGDGPAGIATGAGAIWVTSADQGTVTRIDP